MTQAQLADFTEKYIRTIDYEKFQGFCDRFLLKKFVDYTPVRPGGPKGDMKNDGYCPVARIFFQAHASRGESIQSIKNKILSDLKGCLKKQKDVKEFIYVTNDIQVGEVEAFVDELRKKYKKIKIETWGPLKIAEVIKELPDADIEQVLGISLTPQVSLTYNTNNYINDVYSEEEDLGILKELFDFISNSLGQQIAIVEEEQHRKLVHLVKKIEINFDFIQRTVIKDTYNNLWKRTQLVERFIQDQMDLPSGEELIFALKDDVQSKFIAMLNVQTTQVMINDVSVFDGLAMKYIPDGKQKNPNYHANAKAIILFFFEFCDIGLKTDIESKKSSQGDLFDDIL